MNQFHTDCTRKIVVVGTIFLDIKGYPEGNFYPTGRNKGRIEYIYGGVARNVAEDLAGLGFRPVFVSMADNAGPGSECIRQLNDAGVLTDYILRSENGIGTWMVILTPEGDVCANLSKRQDLTPLCAFLDKQGNEIFSGADGILLEMDVEEAVVARVFSFARRYRVPVYGVISNITIAKERMDYIRETQCFVCNRQEAGVLFDLDMEHMSPERIREILPAEMKKTGIRTMVVTMDKDGAAYTQLVNHDICGQEISGIVPSICVPVADTTGAGDSFFTGVAAGLIDGRGLEDACRIGTEMAAQVITSTENVYRAPYI